MSIARYLNSLLGGCGVERELMELRGILFQIAEEFHTGRMTSEEVQNLVSKLCESIVVLAQRCGRKLDLATCIDKTIEAIAKEVTPGLWRVRMLRSSSRTSTTSSSGPSII